MRGWVIGSQRLRLCKAALARPFNLAPTYPLFCMSVQLKNRAIFFSLVVTFTGLIKTKFVTFTGLTQRLK